MRKIEAGTASNTQEEKLTQNQLQELLETEPARTLLEGAEERGYVLPTELEAFALEHDLADDEVEQLTRELEAIGLEVGEPASEPEEEAQKAREAAAADSASSAGLPTSSPIVSSSRVSCSTSSSGRSCSSANASSSAGST